MDKTPIIKLKPDVEYMSPENYEPPELKIIVTEKEPIKFCPHDQIKIHPHHRVIHCSNCNATLDPFDHLLRVGLMEGNTLTNITWLKHQVKRLQEEEEKLKKSIAQLRKELKKL